MFILKRRSAVALLAAALAAVLTSPKNRARAEDVDCAPLGWQIASNTTWDPLAFDKLLTDFTVESARYSPADRRITWTLRTKKTYTGELGIAERKLRDALEDAFKKTYYCAHFYDAERRKLGSGEVFFVPG